MNPTVMAETAKALKAAGMSDSAIATILAGSMNQELATEPTTAPKAPKKTANPKRKNAAFKLTVDDVQTTDDTRRVADECIGFALATGEYKVQMKIKAAELFSISGLLECKDQENALAAWDKLLTDSIAVPDKITNRNTGKEVPARFTSGPNKGKIKWTISTSLSVLFERGREMIQAFIPMRDAEGYQAAEDKLCPGGVWAAKSVILATRKQFRPKQKVDGVKQAKTNALALKGVVVKYISTKTDAKKAKAEIAPILKEITDMLTKLAK